MFFESIVQQFLTTLNIITNKPGVDSLVDEQVLRGVLQVLGGVLQVLGGVLQAPI